MIVVQCGKLWQLKTKKSSFEMAQMDVSNPTYPTLGLLVPSQYRKQA